MQLPQALVDLLQLLAVLPRYLGRLGLQELAPRLGSLQVRSRHHVAQRTLELVLGAADLLLQGGYVASPGVSVLPGGLGLRRRRKEVGPWHHSLSPTFR